MKVVYTETHWLEFDSRFASKRSSKDSPVSYIGFGCKMPYCAFSGRTCANCYFSFTSTSK